LNELRICFFALIAIVFGKFAKVLGAIQSWWKAISELQKKTNAVGEI
jgi:hypothetical protein